MTCKNKYKIRNGRIPVDRKTYERLGRININLRACYVECCNKARYSIGTWTNPKNLEEIKLNYGQFVFGRFEFAKEIKVEPNSVYRYMKKLEKMRIIKIENHNNQFSIITVYQLKDFYEKYAREDSKRESGEWLNSIT